MWGGSCSACERQIAASSLRGASTWGRGAEGFASTEVSASTDLHARLSSAEELRKNCSHQRACDCSYGRACSSPPSIPSKNKLVAQSASLLNVPADLLLRLLHLTWFPSASNVARMGELLTSQLHPQMVVQNVALPSSPRGGGKEPVASHHWRCETGGCPACQSAERSFALQCANFLSLKLVAPLRGMFPCDVGQRKGKKKKRNATKLETQ